MGELRHPLYRLFDPGRVVNDADDQQGATQERDRRTDGHEFYQEPHEGRALGSSRERHAEESDQESTSPQRIAMTRLLEKLKRSVVEQFQSGASMELLAERLRVGIWQIEAVIRRELKRR